MKIKAENIVVTLKGKIYKRNGNVYNMDFENLLYREIPEIELFMREIKPINDEKLLKPRTGWYNRGIDLPENIFEHMCKVDLAAFYLFGFMPNEARDHELPESAKNGFDYMPGQISAEEKRKLEFEGMKSLVKQIPNGDEHLQGYLDFEYRRTPIAPMVFELDKICPCIEVLNLKKQYDLKEKRLDEFYDKTMLKLKTPQLMDALSDMYQTEIPLSVNAYEIYFNKLKEMKL